MEIHLNISFPHVPCELLTLDVMDVSGEQQVGVMHGVNKVRLAAAEEGGGDIETKAIDLYAFRHSAKLQLLIVPDMSTQPLTWIPITVEGATGYPPLQMHKRLAAARLVTKSGKPMQPCPGLLAVERTWSNASVNTTEKNWMLSGRKAVASRAGSVSTKCRVTFILPQDVVSATVTCTYMTSPITLRRR